MTAGAGGPTGSGFGQEDGGGESPLDAHAAAGDQFAERPELYVGAAFAGGLALAGLLRWLGR